MSENRRIARAAGLVGFFTFVSRIAGLVRDSVTGYYFGTGAAADAFFVAFRAPNLLRRFVAEGAMSVALIPVFTDYLTKHSREEADEAIAAVTTVMSIFIALITIVGVAGAGWITLAFAPGFTDDPAKFELTVVLTRLLFPYIFLVSLVALASGILNSVRHFVAPALSPVFLNLAMIIAAVGFSRFFEQPVMALAYGVVAGGIVQLAMQMPPLWRHGFRVRWLWAPQHEAVRRSFRLMAPMIFGAAVYQINVVVGTVLASMLPGGSVSFLWYSGRVFEFPLGIFAVALGTAALPSFSSQVSRRAFDEMAHSLSFSVRLTNLIAIPATVGITLLALPITSVLFQRGAYSYADCEQTAAALAAYATGLWAVSMVRLVVPAFYALGDTQVPVLTAAAAFVVNLAFSLCTMGAVDPGASAIGAFIASVTRLLAIADMRHVGLALATSVAAGVNLILLVALLHKRLPQLRAAPLIPSFLRSAAASLAMVPGVLYVQSLVDWRSGSLVARGTALSAAVAVGVLTFAVVALLLGGEEVEAMRRVLRERFARMRARG